MTCKIDVDNKMYKMFISSLAKVKTICESAMTLGDSSQIKYYCDYHLPEAITELSDALGWRKIDKKQLTKNYSNEEVSTKIYIKTLICDPNSVDTEVNVWINNNVFRKIINIDSKPIYGYPEGSTFAVLVTISYTL